MSVLLPITCPTDCTSSLPPVDFNECAPEVHYGEISHLYIATADATCFTNVEQITEWTTRVSESEMTANAIRDLVVMADLGEPEQTEQPISGDRTVVGFKSFTINIDVDETNDINYRFLMNLECNTKYKLWFETADGLLYGGNCGIEGTLRLNNIIPRDRTEIAKFSGTFKWKSQFSPYRSLSPLS